MLPDVDAEDRRLAFGDRRILIGGRHHGQLATVDDEPRPARTEALDAGVGHRSLECIEATTVSINRCCKGTGRRTTIRTEDLPEEGVVGMATSVVAHRTLLVGGQRRQLRQELVDWGVLPIGASKRCVGVVDVGLVMTIVMDLHREGIDVGLECVERVVESGKFKGHGFSSGGVGDGGSAECSVVDLGDSCSLSRHYRVGTSRPSVSRTMIPANSSCTISAAAPAGVNPQRAASTSAETGSRRSAASTFEAGPVIGGSS